MKLTLTLTKLSSLILAQTMLTCTHKQYFAINCSVGIIRDGFIFAIMRELSDTRIRNTREYIFQRYISQYRMQLDENTKRRE